jgi:hypothetical protein
MMDALDFDPDLAEDCREQACKLELYIAQRYPKLDEAMVATYTLNALLMAAYEIADRYEIPVGVLLRTVAMNYAALHGETDDEPLH